MGLAEPWRHLCATPAGPFEENYPDVVELLAVQTLQLLGPRTKKKKNEFVDIFAVKWITRKYDPRGCLDQKEIGETKAVHHVKVAIIFSVHALG